MLVEGVAGQVAEICRLLLLQMDSELCRWLFLCNGLSPVELWPPRRFWCAGARFFAVPVVTGVMAVVEGTHDVGASSWVVGAFSSRMVDQVVIRAIARIFDGWQVWPKKSSFVERAGSGACASRLPVWLPRIARCAPSRNQPLAGARLRSRCVFETTLDGLDGAGQTPLKRTIRSCPSGYLRQRK